MSSIEEKQALIREHVRLESEHDLEGLLDVMSEDAFTDVLCAPPRHVGKSGVAERYRGQWGGFPDFTVRIRKVVALSDKYAVSEHEWSGTHLGVFLGMPPTGKRVKVKAAVIWEFKGDKIKGETIYYDLATVQRQMGLNKRPRRTTASSAASKDQGA